jgi:hypothetical protein
MRTLFIGGCILQLLLVANAHFNTVKELRPLTPFIIIAVPVFGILYAMSAEGDSLLALWMERKRLEEKKRIAQLANSQPTSVP